MDNIINIQHLKNILNNNYDISLKNTAAIALAQINLYYNKTNIPSNINKKHILVGGSLQAFNFNNINNKTKGLDNNILKNTIKKWLGNSIDQQFKPILRLYKKYFSNILSNKQNQTGGGDTYSTAENMEAHLENVKNNNINININTLLSSIKKLKTQENKLKDTLKEVEEIINYINNIKDNEKQTTIIEIVKQITEDPKINLRKLLDEIKQITKDSKINFGKLLDKIKDTE